MKHPNGARRVASRLAHIHRNSTYTRPQDGAAAGPTAQFKSADGPDVVVQF